jgi:biopolymer transport protein ExbB/TolQ
MPWDGKAKVRAVMAAGIALMALWTVVSGIEEFFISRTDRAQSEAFAPEVSSALRNGNMGEAIKIAERFKKSHLAKVVVAGLQEFRSQQSSKRTGTETIDRCRRALARAENTVQAEREGREWGFSTMSVVAPVFGLIGTLLLVRLQPEWNAPAFGRTVSPLPRA